MATKKTFYVTTPIYYVNGEPHIGSAYTTIAADVLARWQRLQGKSVFFLTGTDEHGQKIQEIAEERGLKPKQFVDEIAEKFKEVFSSLNVSNDHFIRTTDKEHEKEVQKVVQELYDKKFIYKGFYESEYCVGCEQYKTKSELVDGLCPLHKTKPQIIKEESYMFKLSAFQDKLLKLIEKGEYEILPLKRRNEVIAFIKEGLQDISISRKKSKVSWGIELPFDKEHTTFVWVDAFWNYITGLQAKKAEKKFWPPTVQLMANDILRVHATIWPALLLALGKKLPKTLFIHGYFTVDGHKMSKSLGNVISPVDLIQKYGAESVRYFLFRNIAFGEDGDFSERSLVERHNNELANKLGNLISRVSTLAETYGLQKTKPLDSEKLYKTVSKHFERYEIDRALAEIFAYIDTINTFVQEKKPWETHDKKVLYQAANAIKDATILLSPFLPETAEKIASIFNFDLSLKALKAPLALSKIKKAPILFKKIDTTMAFPPFKQPAQITPSSPQQKQSKQLSSHTQDNKSPAASQGTISYDDFSKLDLRVGRILKVDDHPKADKLYVITVDLGEEKPRTVVAGLKGKYAKEALINKKAIFVANLAPRDLRGVQSHGMILAAATTDDSQVFFLQPEQDIKEGSKVR